MCAEMAKMRSTCNSKYYLSLSERSISFITHIRYIMNDLWSDSGSVVCDIGPRVLSKVRTWSCTQIEVY